MGKASRKRATSTAVTATPIVETITTTITVDETDKIVGIESAPLVSVPMDREVRLSHRDLKNALTAMTRVIEKNAHLPILQNVAIRSRGRDVEIVGGDLNMWVTTTLTTTSICDPWGTTVNAHKFAALIRSLPAGEIALARGEHHLDVHAGPVNARLACVPDREFPKVPTFGSDASWITADARALYRAIDTTLFSVCRDETRFHLNGALLESDGSTLTMVTTDGHRLTRARAAWSWSGQSLATGMIIPSKGLRELLHLLKGADTCEIGIAKPNLFVRVGTTTVCVKLIDAQFPPYDQVIPKDNRLLVTVATEVLRGAVSRAKVHCCETRGVRLEISEGRLSVVSDNPDSGDVRESFPVDYTGKAFKIGLNATYLLEVLGEISDPSVTMAFDGGKNGELSPMLVRGTEDAGMRSLATSEYLGVIMPMRI